MRLDHKIFGQLRRVIISEMLERGEGLSMASDYTEIRRDNERRYGTDIGRIGPMLLADRYEDRTHFIFELLQNAEDALARRGGIDLVRDPSPSNCQRAALGLDILAYHSTKPTLAGIAASTPAPRT